MISEILSHLVKNGNEYAMEVRHYTHLLNLLPAGCQMQLFPCCFCPECNRLSLHSKGCQKIHKSSYEVFEGATFEQTPCFCAQVTPKTLADVKGGTLIAYEGRVQVGTSILCALLRCSSPAS